MLRATFAIRLADMSVSCVLIVAFSIAYVAFDFSHPAVKEKRARCGRCAHRSAIRKNQAKLSAALEGDDQTHLMLMH